jgi:hypothetical protein
MISTAEVVEKLRPPFFQTLATNSDVFLVVSVVAPFFHPFSSNSHREEENRKGKAGFDTRPWLPK